MCLDVNNAPVYAGRNAQSKCVLCFDAKARVKLAKTYHFCPFHVLVLSFVFSFRYRRRLRSMNDSINVDILCAQLRQHVSGEIASWTVNLQVMQSNDVYYGNDLWRVVLIVVCVCIVVTGESLLSTRERERRH